MKFSLESKAKLGYFIYLILIYPTSFIHLVAEFNSKMKLRMVGRKTIKVAENNFLNKS